MKNKQKRLSIFNKETGLTVTIKHDTHLEDRDILNAYRLADRNIPQDQEAPADDTIENYLKDMYAEANYGPERPADLELKDVDKDKRKPGRPKAIKMVNSEHRLSVPIAEFGGLTFDDDPEQPQEDERVTAHVDCPECGEDADVSVPDHFSFSKCPSCGTKLFNAWATGTKGEVDENGYYFHADKEMIFKGTEEQEAADKKLPTDHSTPEE